MYLSIYHFELRLLYIQYPTNHFTEPSLLCHVMVKSTYFLSLSGAQSEGMYGSVSEFRKPAYRGKAYFLKQAEKKKGKACGLP